jgi:hypothetical protein
MSSRCASTWRPLALATVLAIVSAGCGANAAPDGGQVAAVDLIEEQPAVEAERPAADPPPPADPPADPTDASQVAIEPPEDDAEVEQEPPAEPAPERVVWGSNWAIFATVEGVVLQHPSAFVERVGFHESNHAGAQQLEVFEHAVAPLTLETRDRGTGSRSAADVVVDPDEPLRAPVTGTVLRAGTYVLYCDHRDDYVVIEPDARPGWEVKLLHIDGVRVRAGDRVEGGVTELAPRPTPLPFDSQVDEHTAEPSWPHVHIEVVDPSVPNPSGPSSC